MKPKNIYIILLLLTAIFLQQRTAAQNIVKTYKEPILSIDFGNADNKTTNNVGNLPQYRKANKNCPDDGEYTFASYSKGCFGDRWIYLSEDHTTGDRDGNMMVINASERPSTFFMYAVKNVNDNSNYEFSFWVTNICRTASNCFPNPPNISFVIQDVTGKPLAKYTTGNVAQTGFVNWKKYSIEFTIPSGVNTVVIKLDDETNGGCGNDFAIDDMMMRQFTIKQMLPNKKEIPKQIIIQEIKKPAITNKRIDTTIQVSLKEKKVVPATEKKQLISKAEVISELKKEIAVASTPPPPLIPKILTERSNPIVQKIEILSGEMLIELYDNGEVDGDTVSVYDNNVLLAENAGLSTKPVRLKIKVDKSNPHHEIIMVAKNLGSIPPNTSMMIITANDIRHEVFISSNEEKNAKVVIDLKE